MVTEIVRNADVIGTLLAGDAQPENKYASSTKIVIVNLSVGDTVYVRTASNYEGADRVRGRGEKRGREGGDEGEGGGRRGGGRREERGREEGEEGAGGGRGKEKREG